MTHYIILVIISMLALGVVAVVAIAQNLTIRDRQRNDADTIKRLTNQIIVRDDDQIERMKIEAIEPAANAYRRTVDTAAIRNGWVPPAPADGGVTIPDRGEPLS